MSTNPVSDSPHKAYISKSVFDTATGKPDLFAKKAELRKKMHIKTTIMTLEDFEKEFFLPYNRPPPINRSRRSVRLLTANKKATVVQGNYIKNPFQDMGAFTSERDMYKKLTRTLNNAGLCPGYTFVSTPTRADPTDETKLEADMGLYPDEAVPGHVDSTRTDDLVQGRMNWSWLEMNWSWLEMFIECKMDPTAGDPFDDGKGIGGETDTESRNHVLGQILSYAELVFHRQHRTHQYVVLFLGTFARIVRIDRSGMFATKKFSCAEHGDKLADFFRHYAKGGPRQRGYDDTAVRLKPDSAEAERMRDAVKEVAEADYVGRQFRRTLDEMWSWWKLAVPDSDTKKVRYFLVGKPHFRAPGVIGRTTRGYIALAADDENATFVYLKDAWRVDSDDIDQEGVTLAKLNEHKVMHVPTLICHGDLEGQYTSSTIALWKTCHPGEKDCPLKAHQHYRLVVKEVGKPLDEFANGYELVSAILCAVAAHAEAYNIGIIHCDISAGNILLYPSSKTLGRWDGLLNDWELAKNLTDRNEKGRQSDRTGTWQFMSVNSLMNHSKAITIPDELESFFHVTVYNAVRMLCHNCPRAEVPQFLHDYFDEYTPHTTRVSTCGAMKSIAINNGHIDIQRYRPQTDDKEAEYVNVGADLWFFWSTGNSPGAPVHPLNGIFKELLSWFSAYYTLQRDYNVTASAPRNKQTQNHGRVSRPKEKMSDRFKHLIGTAGDSHQQKHAQPDAVKARTDLEHRAKNLETHAPMILLLTEAIDNQDWPEDDRAHEDKKQQKNAKAQRHSKVQTGSKRTAKATRGRPKKKSKISQ
ncbi:hypothetical protein BC628DRAFT_1317480 [Trametes gibbosa]|nr:hypothetical protein BC628DRAFT_1317480 [Trametes gibbosa]